MRTIIVYKNPVTGQEAEINQRHIDEVAEEFGLDEDQVTRLESSLRKTGVGELPGDGFSLLWRDFEPSGSPDE